MNINDLVKEAHQNAVDHGWWEEPKSMGELLALIHSEVSEALEEHRNGKKANKTYYSQKIEVPHFLTNDVIEERVFFASQKGVVINAIEGLAINPKKPEGIPSELADIVIRVADLCGFYGIDLEAAIKEKMQYNASRPYKHGGKKL